MDYQDFSKVVKVENSDHVNQHLMAGWKLLFIGQCKDEEYSFLEFVLGWPEVLGNPVYPQGWP